jgi:hypothetical protein
MKSAVLGFIVLLVIVYFIVYSKQESFIITNNPLTTQTSFQDKDFYTTNKNNFLNSWNKLYGEIPAYITSSDGYPLNIAKGSALEYYNTFRNQLLRFCTLSQETVTITMPDGTTMNFDLITATLPQGANVYNGGRSPGLNHSKFPIVGYSGNLSEEENKRNIFSTCSTDIRLSDTPSCTIISYYTLPDQNAEYVLGGDNLNRVERTSYRYTLQDNIDKKNIFNPVQDNTNHFGSNYFNKGDFYYSQLEGEMAFKTKSDTKLWIFGFCSMFSNTTNLGHYNVRQIEPVLREFVRQTKPDETDEIMDIFNRVSGNGTMWDNFLLFHENDENGDPNSLNTQAYIIAKKCNRFVYYSNKLSNNNPVAKQYFQFAKGYSKKIYSEALRAARNGVLGSSIQSLIDSDIIDTDLYSAFIYKIRDANNLQIRSYASNLVNWAETEMKKIKGQRQSTYNEDRIILNWIQKMFEASNSDIAGFISSGVFNFWKDLFHQEIALFYAPDILIRDPSNQIDTTYTTNPYNLQQETRKYKTRNLISLTDRSAWHMGHPYEHGSWVALNMIKLARNEDEDEIFVKMMMGLYHDIGKIGKCDYTPYWVYQNLDIGRPSVSVCLKDTDALGNATNFSYFDIPDHPERGYRNLIGTERFDLYNISMNYHSGVPIENGLKDAFKTEDNFRRFRIAEACHWLFGGYLLKNWYNRTSVSGKDTYLMACNFFLKRVEMYYRFEKKAYKDVNINDFLRSVKDCALIGVADILGSRYNPDLQDVPGIHLYNEYPNGDVFEYPPMYLGARRGERITTDELISRSTTIINDLTQVVNTSLFRPNPSNVYATLEILTEYCNSISTIYTMYPSYFPKVIAFDLDGTLISWTDFRDQGPEYKWRQSVLDVLLALQPLRDRGLKVAIASRHYYPTRLRQWLDDYDPTIGRRRSELFDIIVCFYTGREETLRINLIEKIGMDTQLYADQADFVRANGIETLYNRRGNRGKILQDFGITGSEYVTERQKYLHIEIIKQIMKNMGKEVQDIQIVLFDDEDDIIKGNIIQKRVQVIAVPDSSLINNIIDKTGVSNLPEMDVNVYRKGLALATYACLTN